LALARGPFFGTKTPTAWSALSIRWQSCQFRFEFLSPTLDRFFIQTGDLGQLAITGTAESLRKQPNIPTPLWLIQTAQKHIHLPMMTSGFQIGSSLTNITLAPMDVGLCFGCHKPATLPKIGCIIPQVPEIILLWTLSSRF
jgi:hypothetical protein